MPRYDYKCESCDHEFDKIQKITDTTKPPCPECGGDSKRFFPSGKGSPLNIFKGEGFQPVATTNLSRRRRSKK